MLVDICRIIHTCAQWWRKTIVRDKPDLQQAHRQAPVACPRSAPQNNVGEIGGHHLYRGCEATSSVQEATHHSLRRATASHFGILFMMTHQPTGMRKVSQTMLSDQNHFVFQMDSLVLPT